MVELTNATNTIIDDFNLFKQKIDYLFILTDELVNRINQMQNKNEDEKRKMIENINNLADGYFYALKIYINSKEKKQNSRNWKRGARYGKYHRY